MRRLHTLPIALVGVLAVSLLAAPVGVAQSDTISVVAVIGDYGDRSANERAVARLVAEQRPQAIVTTGDNIYGSRSFTSSVARYYGAFMSPSPASNRFWPATGNHDYSDAGMSAYLTAFPALEGHTNYAVTVGDIEFLVVDSTKALHAKESLAWQRIWVRQRARSSTAAWQVVVLHHPPYSSGAVHGSTREFQWPYAAWGVDLVLAGHDHGYERISRSDVTYVVEGSSGAHLYPFAKPIAGSRYRNAKDFGALFLRASGHTLMGEYRTTSGVAEDRFTVDRN